MPLQDTALDRIKSLYLSQDRVERCACGGRIRLHGGHFGHLPVVMRDHQRTLGHRAWRQEQGL